MNNQVYQYLKENDFQGALEILQQSSTNGALLLADYVNEMQLWKQGRTSDELWQAYTSEVLVRIKQISEEEKENPESRKTETRTEVQPARSANPTVFISYNHKDKEIVAKITNYLRENHLDFFLDSISLMGGEVLEESLAQQILARDYFVVLLSKNSLRSNWVSFESNLSNMKAIAAKGKVVPVRMDDCLDDFEFQGTVLEEKQAELDALERHMKKSRKYVLGHQHLSDQRQIIIDFMNNFDKMLARYRGMANINISGDLFGEGMKRLIAVVGKTK